MKTLKEKDYEHICDERKHMEDLLCNRFNFFLTFFSIIIAGAITSIKLTDYAALWTSFIILLIGFIICFLMSFPLRQCQVKLNIILDIMLLAYDHPNNMAKKIINEIKYIIKKKGEKKFDSVVEIANLKESDIETIKSKLTKLRTYYLIRSRSYRDYVGFVIPNVCLLILLTLIIINIIFLINQIEFLNIPNANPAPNTCASCVTKILN